VAALDDADGSVDGAGLLDPGIHASGEPDWLTWPRVPEQAAKATMAIAATAAVAAREVSRRTEPPGRMSRDEPVTSMTYDDAPGRRVPALNGATRRLREQSTPTLDRKQCAAHQRLGG
jgi:hypothetical protein